MSKEHIIARVTVKHFIKTKNEFAFIELENTILENGGIMRVSIGISVSDYLENFEADGVVKKEIRNDGVWYIVHNNKLNYPKKLVDTERQPYTMPFKKKLNKQVK